MSKKSIWQKLKSKHTSLKKYTKFFSVCIFFSHFEGTRRDKNQTFRTLVTLIWTEMAALTIQNSLQWSIQLYEKKENHGDN